MGSVIPLHGGSPGAPAWGQGRTSRTPQPGLAWPGLGTCAGNRWQEFHTVCHEPAVLEKPHLYTNATWPCPGTAGWLGAPGGQAAGLGLSERKGEVSITAGSWPPCAPGDLPLLLPLPRGPQCPSRPCLAEPPWGSRTAVRLSSRLFAQRPCLSAASFPSGFSGSPFPTPIPLFCTK